MAKFKARVSVPVLIFIRQDVEVEADSKKDAIEKIVSGEVDISPEAYEDCTGGISTEYGCTAELCDGDAGAEIFVDPDDVEEIGK